MSIFTDQKLCSAAQFFIKTENKIRENCKTIFLNLTYINLMSTFGYSQRD
jgi:hypothetical protein